MEDFNILSREIQMKYGIIKLIIENSLKNGFKLSNIIYGNIDQLQKSIFTNK